MLNSTIPILAGAPPQNNNAQISELKGLLGKLPNYFDTSALEKGYSQQQQFNTSVGEQASNNASREFINRQALQGGDRSLGGLVRAQSMLPFLQQNADIEGKKQTAKLDASSALAKLTGDVSTNLGQLRTSYLGTLANYTSNLQQLSSNATLQQQGRAQQGQQFQQQLGLDQQRLGLQRQQQNWQQNQGQQQLDLQRLLALDQHSRNTRSTTTFGPSAYDVGGGGFQFSF